MRTFLGEEFEFFVAKEGILEAKLPQANSMPGNARSSCSAVCRKQYLQEKVVMNSIIHLKDEYQFHSMGFNVHPAAYLNYDHVIVNWIKYCKVSHFSWA